MRRKTGTQVKLKSGDPVELAEVVRDGTSSAAAFANKSSKSQLTSGEKDLYNRARRLLSEEISLVRGVRNDEADAWIERQLRPTD